MKTKKLILLNILFCLSFSIQAQMMVEAPITDSQLASINANIIAMNKQLIAQNKLFNELLSEINISNNHLNSILSTEEKIHAIDQEMINSKKTPDNFVHNSSDVKVLMDLKTEIVSSFNMMKSSVNNFEKISSDERKKFLSLYAINLVEIYDLFTHSKDVVSTNAIIDPQERISIVKDNTYKVKSIAQKTKEYFQILNKLNTGRQLSNSISTF